MGGFNLVDVHDIIQSVAALFWERVDVRGPDDCWEWRGGTVSTGYGIAAIPGSRGARRMGAHRLAYLYHHGVIDDELTLDHPCRNKMCCNPRHLEEVTAAENGRRSDSPPARNARKTHCKRGHEFTPANTLRNGTGRKCRTCHNELHQKRYKSRMKERV